jgi:hypothetical protein
MTPPALAFFALRVRQKSYLQETFDRGGKMIDRQREINILNAVVASHARFPGRVQTRKESA